jgi:hypothetical protein
MASEATTHDLTLQHPPKRPVLIGQGYSTPHSDLCKRFFENFNTAASATLLMPGFSIRFTFVPNRLKNGGCRFAGRFHL